MLHKLNLMYLTHTKYRQNKTAILFCKPSGLTELLREFRVPFQMNIFVLVLIAGELLCPTQQKIFPLFQLVFFSLALSSCKEMYVYGKIKFITHESVFFKNKLPHKVDEFIKI